MVKLTACTLEYEGHPESKSVVQWTSHPDGIVDLVETNKRATLYIRPDKLMLYVSYGKSVCTIDSC